MARTLQTLLKSVGVHGRMGAAIYTMNQGYGERHRPQVRRVPTVLIVDDERTVLQMVSDILEDEDLRILTAASGHEALAVAARDHPDLVITDLMMPGINGRVLCERLRAHPNLAHIPVLLMTAAYKVQAPEEFAAIIPKPFDVDDLLSQVQRHLKAS